MTTCYFCGRELRTVVTVRTGVEKYDCGRACAREFIAALRRMRLYHSVVRWHVDGKSATA